MLNAVSLSIKYQYERLDIQPGKVGISSKHFFTVDILFSNDDSKFNKYFFVRSSVVIKNNCFWHRIGFSIIIIFIFWLKFAKSVEYIHMLSKYASLFQ